jgi:predicted AlkP superfamily pyrophosphatase or phosphodiesterase
VRSKHALIFGIDGCRADALKLAVETGKAPNIAKLIQTGTVTWTAYAGGELDKPTQQDTFSGPGWSSIFTAVWHDKHGVTDNSFRGSNFTRYPNFLERVRSARPNDDVVSLVTWPPIHEHIFQPTNEKGRCTCHTYVHSDPLVTEEKLVRNTILEVSTGNPSVVFCYQGLIDTVGHQSGFSPAVSQYMEAIRISDERIGQVIDAVNKRPQFSNEDWLFVVCTDHGGIRKVHGGQSPEERIIPLIVSGGETPKGLVSQAVVGQIAVPATVMRHLQLKVDPAWGWVGKAFPEIETQTKSEGK